ncbi:hypothetical protein QTP86_014281, partial [Hemibagrus guttatus]
MGDDKANTKACPREHHSSPLHMSNRFALLSEAPTEKPGRALVIRDSILRHVKLVRPLGAPAAQVRCIPGARAPDIAGSLMVLGKHRFSKIVFHVGDNDIRLHQSEVTKSNIVEVCKLAKVMSDAVVCSGPIPMQRGDVAYSRLWSLNCWMSRWCSENNVGFIDNWSSFEGKAGLLGRDGVHPTREGAALISCSIAHSLRADLVNRYTSHSQAPSVLSFQCDHWLYPWSESRRLVVLTDAVDGSVWKACHLETAVDRATWGP